MSGHATEEASENPCMNSIRGLHRCLALVLLGFLAATAGSQPLHASQRPRATQPCASVTPQTCALAQSLGRGINLGNMLDAPREGDWGIRYEPAFIDRIAGNFSTVRLPVRWSNNAALTADATIDEAFAARVDQIVDTLLARGFYVILNVHHYSQIHGDSLHGNESPVDPAVLEHRLVNMWKQIGARYKDRSPKLIFELLNEPHGRLNGEPWNVLAARTLATVRATNPTRTVMIGPGEWNAIPELPRLRVPQDRNVIVSIHNYDPFDFTHQGIEYLPRFPVGPKCCNTSQRRQIIDALDAAQRWSRATGYPLHLGEFGAYEKADMDSREAYTRIVRDEAEKRGIGWAYWEFGSSFGVFSPKTGGWVEPIRRALLD